VHYLMIRGAEREALLNRLADMPEFLTARFSGLSPQQSQEPGPGGSFSPVEHCWHLADLEAEGFGVRIRRLRDEAQPSLPDFDGTLVARERRYRERSLAGGLEAFRHARRANLDAVRAIRKAQWLQSGIQAGVGRVTLCDIPHMMAEHDATHRSEIETWGL